MINTIIRKAITQNRIPTKEAISSGAVEKAVIPSMEYTSSFQKFHLVSPLARSILTVIRGFHAVEHRIEFVATKGGVDYYNDSKGTNPDAAIQGIKAMSRPTVLIGGG